MILTAFLFNLCTIVLPLTKLINFQILVESALMAIHVQRSTHVAKLVGNDMAAVPSQMLSVVMMVSTAVQRVQIAILLLELVTL